MIAVIDYGVGNLFSVEKALLQFTSDVIVTNDEEKIASAQKLVLPGVGDFGECMRNLEKTGLIPVIMDKINSGTPLLGICMGQQILFEGSEESPGAKGLGIFKGMVKRINAPGLKVPHMGWNNLNITNKDSRILNGIDAESYVYFVHSFYADADNKAEIAATCDYTTSMDVVVEKGNVFGCQFHPEKSSNTGLHILKNFLEIK